MLPERKEERFPCSGLVDVVQVRDGRRVYCGAALVHDVSESGVCVQMDSAVKLQSTVVLKSRKAEVTAVVRNTRSLGQGFAVGLEFVGGFKWRPDVDSPFSSIRLASPPSQQVLHGKSNPATDAPPSGRSQVLSVLMHRIRAMHDKMIANLGIRLDPEAQASAETSTLPSRNGAAPRGLMLLEDAPTKAIVLDDSLNIKYANNAFLRVFGSAALLTNRAFTQFVVREDLHRVNECARSVTAENAGIKTLEFSVRGADERIRLMSSQWKYSKSTRQTVVHLHDVTHRRAEEAELISVIRDPERSAKPIGIAHWKWDIKTKTVQCSREYVQLYGLDPGTSTVDLATWKSMLHPDDRARVQAEIDSTIASTGHINVEFRIIRPDGSTATLAASGHVTYDQTGQPVTLSGQTIDITHRKETEALVERLASRLYLTNAALQMVLGYLPIGALIVDAATGDVIASNDSLHRVLGSAAKAEAYKEWITLDSEGRPYPREQTPLIRSLTASEVTTNRRLRMCTAGVISDVVVSSMPMQNEKGETIAAICTIMEDDARSESHSIQERAVTEAIAALSTE